MNDNLIYVLLESIYGAFYVSLGLRSERTISPHTISVADSSCEQIKELLLTPLKEKAFTICPDYWTDSCKKISYLGVTVSIVDDQYNYKSIDACCRPFQYRKKTAEHTFNVSETVLHDPRFLM